MSFLPIAQPLLNFIITAILQKDQCRHIFSIHGIINFWIKLTTIKKVNLCVCKTNEEFLLKVDSY